jgi:hypothetical protein
MATKPLKPTEIAPNLEYIVPEVVVKAVNELLQEKYTGGKNSFTIKQDEVVERILNLDPTIEREEIFEKKMLNFEDLYRKNGWSVKFDKPGWDENYKAFFEFKPIVE